jgi:putative membrane protein
MLASALVAFGHFFAFFALTAAIVLTLALLGESMSVDAARRVQRADRAAGFAAGLILVFGTLRVLYFEKGGEYYGDNLFFQIKIGLFLLAALISIYPTSRFRGWKRQLDQNMAPIISGAEVKKLQRALHWELVMILGMVLCASLMARGFGS